MIFMVCLLLHVTLLCADVDDIQAEEIVTKEIVDGIDNGTVEITVAIELDDDLPTEQENGTTEVLVSELPNTVLQNNAVVEHVDNQMPMPKVEQVGSIPDMQDEDEQITTDEIAIEEEAIESVAQAFTEQAEDEENDSNIESSVDTVAHVSPVYDSATIHSQKNGLLVQTTSSITSTDAAYPKKITVVNTITPEKTAYTHWTGTYMPEFTVTVEGQSVGMSCKEHIELNSTTMSVAYYAQFPAQRSSEDSILVNIEKNTQTVAVDFDWHSEPRLRITQSS